MQRGLESQIEIKLDLFLRNDLRTIADIKMKDLNANTIEQAVEMIRGTCVSMGIEIKGLMFGYEEI